MKLLWCWRCQMELPMLDEAEFERVMELLRADMTSASPGNLRGRQDAALEEFARITGFVETNALALHHHRLSLYGPACGRCGRPLRTPAAKQCVACGSMRGTGEEARARFHPQ